MSRRGLIIRLVIFGPLFIYFGFAAIQKCRLEQAAEAEAAKNDADIKANTKRVPLGDGRSIEVIEMTPEQAAQYGYKPPEVGPGAPDAKTPDAKAPEVKAPDAKTPDAKAPEAGVDAKAGEAKAADAKAN